MLPSFGELSDCQWYCKNTVLWDAMKSIAAPRRTLSIFVWLIKKAWSAIETLLIETLTSQTGVSSILSVMNKLFWPYAGTMLYTNLSDSLGCSWDKHSSVKTFVVWSHVCLHKIRNMNMHKKLKRGFLLKQSRLNIHDHNLVEEAEGGDCTPRALSMHLMNAFYTKSLSASSICTVSQAFRWYRAPPFQTMSNSKMAQNLRR